MPAIVRKYWIYITTCFFSVLAVLAFATLWQEKEVWPELVMANHIFELKKAFDNIASTAGILSFEHDHNYIDFLNVEKFEGSEIGSMNLIEPKKWNGPYFTDNPTIQEKYYQIVQTKDGYFIVPGPGVRLKNGKVIGKDIIFNRAANIRKMMSDPNYLLHEGKALAAQITLSTK